MKTYIWDEIGMEIVKVTNPEQIDGDWTEQLPEGNVRVFISDRGHVGLQVEANTEAEAHMAFLSVRPYREMTEY